MSLTKALIPTYVSSPASGALKEIEIEIKFCLSKKNILLLFRISISPVFWQSKTETVIIIALAWSQFKAVRVLDFCDTLNRKKSFLN